MEAERSIDLARNLGDDTSTVLIALLVALLLNGLLLVFFTRRERRRPSSRTHAVDAKEAKRRAKRENERVKLSATFLNGTGIAILFTTAIGPMFRAFGSYSETLPAGPALTGLLASLSFHLLGLWILRFWRSEE